MFVLKMQEAHIRELEKKSSYHLSTKFLLPSLLLLLHLEFFCTVFVMVVDENPTNVQLLHVSDWWGIKKLQDRQLDELKPQTLPNLRWNHLSLFAPPGILGMLSVIQLFSSTSRSTLSAVDVGRSSLLIASGSSHRLWNVRVIKWSGILIARWSLRRHALACPQIYRICKVVWYCLKRNTLEVPEKIGLL